MNFHSEEDVGSLAANWDWLCWSIDAWSNAVFSVVLAGVWSLLNSLSMAFSPLTMTSFAACGELSCLDDPVSYLARFPLIDFGMLSSFPQRRIVFDTDDYTTLAKDEKLTEIHNELSSLVVNLGDTIWPMTILTSVTNDNASCSETMSSRTKTRSFDDETISSFVYRNTPCNTSDLPHFTIDYSSTDSNYNVFHRPQKRKRGSPVVLTPETQGNDTHNNQLDFGSNGDDSDVFEEILESKKKSRLLSPSITPTIECQMKTLSETDSDNEEKDCEGDGNTVKKSRRNNLEQQKYERNWEAMFDLLVEHKRRRGDTEVPVNFVRTIELGKWVSNQRSAHRMNRLTDRQVKKLESVGFSWKPQQNMDTWMDYYRRLVAYKEEHNGSTAVPRKYHEDRRLGAWVSRQRKQFRKKELLIAHIELLSSIGFIWDPRVTWDRKKNARS